MATRPTAEVSAAEISRNFGVWQDKAMTTPVIVTRHGKPRVVLLSADAYNATQDTPGEPGSPTVHHEHAQKALLSHMIEGFVAFDDALRVTTVNRAFENMMGRDGEALIGRTLQDSYPNAQQLFIEFLRRPLKTGDVSEIEFPSALMAGRFYRARAFPYLDGVAAVLQSRQEEHDTQHLQSVLLAKAAAAEGLPGVSSALLSLRGAFSELSDGFSKMIGLAADDLVGKSFAQLVKPISRAAVGMAIETCVSERAVSSVEAVMFTEGLTERPVTIAFAPIIETEAVCGLSVAVVLRG